MRKGDDLVARRIVTLIASFCVVAGLGIVQADRTFGQDQTKKDAAAPPTKNNSVTVTM